MMKTDNDPLARESETASALLHQLLKTDRRAQMHALLPLINSLVLHHVSHQDIIDTLSNAGLPVTLAALRKALYRWRKRQPAPSTTASPHASAAPLLPASATRATSPQTSSSHAPITTKGDLVRLRQSGKPLDLNELAAIGRQK